MNQKEKGRVFVFDDDADSLQSIVAALRRAGYHVFPCADPRHGLASVDPEAGDGGSAAPRPASSRKC